jgi:hypothetical protein
MCVAAKDSPGRSARSHVRTVAFDGTLSCALVRIETGRTHQIRVHLQHRCTPILGDATYGTSEWNTRARRSHGVDRPLLHAYQTAFRHPMTGEDVCLTAPLPDDIMTLLSEMRASEPSGGAGADSGSGAGKPAVGHVVDAATKRFCVDTSVNPPTPLVEGSLERRGFVPLDRLRLEEVFIYSSIHLFIYSSIYHRFLVITILHLSLCPVGSLLFHLIPSHSVSFPLIPTLFHVTP